MGYVTGLVFGETLRGRRLCCEVGVPVYVGNKDGQGIAALWFFVWRSMAMAIGLVGPGFQVVGVLEVLRFWLFAFVLGGWCFW